MMAFVDSPLWNRPNAQLSWCKDLGRSGDARPGDEVSPDAAPARAEDLSGLPAAYVATAELDRRRDEGILYAQRMLGAGVSVELHPFPGAFHRSSLMAGAAGSRRQRTELTEALRRALGRAEPTPQAPAERPDSTTAPKVS